MLISEKDKLQIRAALKSVTDTFFVTPVIYHLSKDSAEWFNEDRSDEEFTNYSLKAMVEYPKEKILPTLQGSVHMADVKCTFNMEDLIAASFVNAEKMAIGKAEKDFITVNGQRYRVSSIYYDGPLDKQNILIIIEGEKDKDKT
jgi:hypothetical protein